MVGIKIPKRIALVEVDGWWQSTTTIGTRAVGKPDVRIMKEYSPYEPVKGPVYLDNTPHAGFSVYQCSSNKWYVEDAVNCYITEINQHNLAHLIQVGGIGHDGHISHPCIWVERNYNLCLAPVGYSWYNDAILNMQPDIPAEPGDVVLLGDGTHATYYGKKFVLYYTFRELVSSDGEKFPRSTMIGEKYISCAEVIGAKQHIIVDKNNNRRDPKCGIKAILTPGTGSPYNWEHISNQLIKAIKTKAFVDYDVTQSYVCQFVMGYFEYHPIKMTIQFDEKSYDPAAGLYIINLGDRFVWVENLPPMILPTRCQEVTITQDQKVITTGIAYDPSFALAEHAMTYQLSLHVEFEDGTTTTLDLTDYF